ncbi:probable cytochrome P450 6a14 [Acyrthosiphon pisum]|uniref:Cytochrome P450 n=2 Tax=Acyrthosiphon pisum TaxID=7029 RepID=A0A8R2H5Z0_ACYPI|nr:probable cytochrome P450 6a14 [Acyrthosiphon pisum]XP_016657118.1 probable cytochrome P450 6a14 [Acyrthosiphon pisum]XP_029344865.1 probable cytochrome P450 6a14 [Acyrthosiphon pisum]|eukprot:XP_001944599.2 PREDICTED: probable cytochrome P450 6a14 [Acyrthosiphon pisum]
MFPAVVIIVACCTTVILFLYKYTTYTYKYWKSKSVTFATPVPLFGNIKDHVTLKMTQGECLKNIYNDFPREKFVGMYQLQTPTLLLRDPETIRLFLVKSFAHFTDRGFSYDGHREPLTKHLVNLEGDTWKILRQKLTPTFSSGKIKSMLGLLQGCGVQLIEYMDATIESGKTEFEIRDLTAKFTTDVIGTCAFGLECNSLKDSQSEFRRMGCAVLNSSASLALAKMVRVFFPKLFKALKLRTFPAEVQQFFMGIVKQTIDFRNTNRVRRNDFIQLLLEIKNQNHNQENAIKSIELTEELIAAQVFVFFLAGFETSSTTLSFCLHEMAVNQDIQNRVYDEINETANMYGLPFSYEAISSMNYLEQCLKETMRKYPPVQALARVCTKQFRVPGTDLDLDVGTAVLIPVYAIHHDPQYYPEPDTFNPDRFAKDGDGGGGDNGRPSGVFLPFGDGPRICIGMRFAMLEMKLALAQFLHRYLVTLSDKSCTRIEFEPASFLSCPKGGIWLNVNKRKA